MMEISLGSREYQINPQISGSNNIYTSALQPCLSWSNYQLREEYSCDNSMEEYSSAADIRHSAPAAILCSDVLDNMDLNESDLLLRSSGSVLVLQGTESTSNYNLNAACSNSINNSNSNAVQVVLNNDKVVEKTLADPGTAGILSRARHHDPISSSCASDPHPLVVDSIAGDDSNYFNVGTTHKFYHMSSNFRAPPPSESFPAESRDHQYCLLSGSDHMSGTDKSAEDDDGISVLFSDGGNKQLLYLSQVGAAASSSGEKSHDNINNAILDVHWSSSSYTTRASEPDDPASSSRAAPAKKPRSEKAEKNLRAAKNISFRQPKSSNSDQEEPDMEAIAQMKEMIYRAAAFRPVNFGVDQEVVLEKPKRKNVRISSDPQTVAARQRRERISQRIRVLQRLVPGGSKMDTASMLDEAANYLKFLKSQVTALEKLGGGHKKLDHSSMNNATSSSLTFSPHQKYFNHTIFPMQNFVPHDHTTRSSKP